MMQFNKSELKTVVLHLKSETVTAVNMVDKKWTSTMDVALKHIYRVWICSSHNISPGSSEANASKSSHGQVFIHIKTSKYR